MKVTKQEHEQALETLRRSFPKGSTVYTLFLGRSRSGMARFYSVIQISKTGPSWPNWAACAGAGAGQFIGSYQGRTCVRVNGCGFSASDEIFENIKKAVGHNLQHREL